ncbi:MAG: hypothetical protein FWD15_01165 [Alphaproteobacteria bacterium]|nr:hypothetical protein [Alphaproteobacteria bacterium]
MVSKKDLNTGTSKLKKDITKKEFTLAQILNITTGYLVSDGRIDDVYDVLNFMTGDDLMTHSLPRATEFAKPFLLKQFPQLKEADFASIKISGGIDPDKFPALLRQYEKKFGNSFVVSNEESKKQYQGKNPILGLSEMMDKAKRDR